MSAHAMKAAVLVSYDMDFRVTDLLRPQPGRGEVLVRIAASGVNTLDTKISDGAAAHARHASTRLARGDEWWTARRIQA
jgi:NADPH2:quinone reductase